MKTILAIAFAACTLVACSDGKTNDTTTGSTTTTVAPATATVTTTTTVEPRTPSEGDVTYTRGKVRVYRGNTWTDADNDVKLDNGVIIYRNGRATRNGLDVEWEEGYVVDRGGNVWDKTGHAIGDAWDATKHDMKEELKR